MKNLVALGAADGLWFRNRNLVNLAIVISLVLVISVVLTKLELFPA